jgi:hypothetical protein
MISATLLEDKNKNLDFQEKIVFFNLTIKVIVIGVESIIR